jgi:hypothetical protein
MKKQIWILLSFLTVVSVIFTWKYWEVFPIVNLSITMDKKEAIHEAQAFVHANQFDIRDYDVVTQFKEESMLQAFVELEGGGKQVFLDMIKNDYYQPYQWSVRFYKHGKISEYFVNFTPNGKLYEFSIKIPETEKGSALSKDKALEVVLRGLEQFAVDLSLYDLVEHNTVMQPSGRVDHKFVYERKDISLEKGRYRLELKVYGDIFAGLERKIKIPDEFTRRYQQMFADNKLLANVARNAAILIYVFIFLLMLALFFFQDLRFLQLKKHAYLGSAFWFIMFLTMINKWPFLWNFYSTEYSPLLFTCNQLATMIIISLLFSAFVYLLMILVDAADRYIFGWHIQFLKSWSTDAASSVQLFEMTVLGYMGAAIFLGYEVLYNLWTLKMGWWSPLGRLVDPNILSNYIPFLSPIGFAFQAGFWEEFACRGLPLAGIAFLTRNSKHEKRWFLLFFVLQAVIFGALHANYPQQPFYNRLIELMIPSFVFAVIYYVFGILPGIIMHFVYDAFLMCIPIWVSGLFIQKVLALLCMGIPLFVVVFAWYRNKMKLKQAPSSLYNHAQHYQDPLTDEVFVKRSVGYKLERKYVVLLIAIALMSVICSYLYLPHNFSNSRSKISGQQALKIAKHVVEQYGFTSDPAYISSVNFIRNNQTSENKFIWQTYGKTSYENLEQDYIPAHGWEILWKNFTGILEERAEMFGVTVSVDGEILKIVHSIPEFRHGADLDAKDAQKIALDFIKQVYGFEKDRLELVSCESKKHEHRRDYIVTYKDLKRYDFKPDLGQARIIVSLAGDKLQEIKRVIYVPEKWSRQENGRVMQDAILNTILYAIVLIFIIFAAYFSIQRFRLSIKFLIPIFALTACYVLFRSLNLLNAWDQILMTLSTAEPWVNQIVSLVSSYFIYYLAIGFVIITLLSLLIQNGARAICKTYLPWIIGLIFIGAAVQCLKFWFMNISVHMIPLDYESDYINYKIPAFGMLIAYFLYKVLLGSLELMSFSIIAQRLTTIYQALFFMLIGIVTSDLAMLSNISVWIASGICMGLVLYLLHRLIISHDLESVFLITFGASFVKLLPTVLFLAYPGILVQVGVSGVIFFIFIMYLYRKS